MSWRLRRKSKVLGDFLRCFLHDTVAFQISEISERIFDKFSFFFKERMRNFRGFACNRRTRRKNTKFCPHAAEIARVRAKKTHFPPRMRQKKNIFFGLTRSKHEGSVCFLPSPSSFLRSFLPYSGILSRLVCFLPHPAIYLKKIKCNLCVAVCDSMVTGCVLCSWSACSILFLILILALTHYQSRNTTQHYTSQLNRNPIHTLT